MKFLSEWETIIEEISRLEIKYNTTLINCYSRMFNQVIDYLHECFIKFRFDQVVKNDAKINGFYDNNRIKIIFAFNQPQPILVNHALLTIIKNSARNDFRIFVKPTENIYVPSITKSAYRPKPKSRTEADNYIKKIEDEYFNLSEKEKQLSKIKVFAYSYCLDRENITDELIMKLDVFESVNLLIDKIINFDELLL